MAIKTVSGGGVTVTMSAPSFPASMTGVCDDFSCWIVSLPSTDGPAQLCIRAKWTVSGVDNSADVASADYISLDGASGDNKVSGAGTFA